MLYSPAFRFPAPQAHWGQSSHSSHFTFGASAYDYRLATVFATWLCSTSRWTASSGAVISFS